MGQPDALAGLAIGAMLFDLILGSFNFLRASTTGLTAQAFGRHDQHAAAGRLLAGADLGARLRRGAFLSVAAASGSGAEADGTGGRRCELRPAPISPSAFSPAPAALANYAILGFVLGRGQGGVGLLLQTIINGTNIVLAIYLGLGLDWGVAGVAWGTMVGETAGAVIGLADRPPRLRPC